MPLRARSRVRVPGALRAIRELRPAVRDHPEPLAILGALGLQLTRGFANDVFCQIGLVMLIGLSSKNAILIVEFAEQLREQGKSAVDAAILAATTRLRPILMTSIAFLFGVIPLMLAGGAGAAARNSLGTTVFGGMLVSTAVNLIVIPSLYVLVTRLRRAKHAAVEGGGAQEAFAPGSKERAEKMGEPRKRVRYPRSAVPSYMWSSEAA